jgi:hypothetical protein
MNSSIPGFGFSFKNSNSAPEFVLSTHPQKNRNSFPSTFHIHTA